MAAPSVWFGMGDCHWIAERESIGFIGTIKHGTVEFLITSGTLVQLLDPDRETLDPQPVTQTPLPASQLRTLVHLAKGAFQTFAPLSGWPDWQASGRAETGNAPPGSRHFATAFFITQAIDA